MSLNLFRLLTLLRLALRSGTGLRLRLAAGCSLGGAAKNLVPAAYELLGCARVNCVSGHLVLPSFFRGETSGVVVHK